MIDEGPKRKPNMARGGRGARGGGRGGPRGEIVSPCLALI